MCGIFVEHVIASVALFEAFAVTFASYVYGYLRTYMSQVISMESLVTYVSDYIC